jgi:hypothetical protein
MFNDFTYENIHVSSITTGSRIGNGKRSLDYIWANRTRFAVFGYLTYIIYKDLICGIFAGRTKHR